MTRIIWWGAGVIAGVLVAAAASARAKGGTTTHKRTYLTFKGAVQVPGATLPAGKYVFQIADPPAQTLWQVLDVSGRRVLAEFFFVSTGNRTVQEQNHANGKPIVRFYETARGVAPALKILYYPWDSAGYVFLYPKSQAEQIAAITRQPVLATDSDPAKSRLAHVMTVQPESDAASQTVEAVDSSR
jgi:hypothetical protein